MNIVHQSPSFKLEEMVLANEHVAQLILGSTSLFFVPRRVLIIVGPKSSGPHKNLKIPS